jgi:hypothetical protein
MPVHTRARVAEQQSQADRILAAERTRQRLGARKAGVITGNAGKRTIPAKNSAKQGQKRDH